jgi:hypothetical protein
MPCDGTTPEDTGHPVTKGKRGPVTDPAFSGRAYALLESNAGLILMNDMCCNPDDPLWRFDVAAKSWTRLASAGWYTGLAIPSVAVNSTRLIVSWTFSDLQRSDLVWQSVLDKADGVKLLIDRGPVQLRIVATDQEVYSLGVASTSSTQPVIARFDLATQETKILATLPGSVDVTDALSLVRSGNTLFALVNGEISAVGTDGSGFRKVGTLPATDVEVSSNKTQMVVSGDTLFISEDGVEDVVGTAPLGQLRSIPTAGGQPSTIVDHAAVLALAADDHHVFFATRTQKDAPYAIMRLVR